MSLRAALYGILVVATALVYALMVLGTLPAISREAGGLMPFDLRPSGYSFAEAQTFVTALSAEGRALYLGLQHTLDLFYPALLAGFLVWSIRAQATAVGGRRAGGMHIIGSVAAVLGMVFDYLENRAVAAMLRAADLQEGMVSAASNWTLAKSAASTVAMVVLLALLVWRVIRHRQQGQEAQ